MKASKLDQTCGAPQGAGVTSQGGPIPIPCGATSYVDWDRPSPRIMEYMVENPEFYLKMTEPRAREMMGQDIIDAARELGIRGEQLEELTGRIKEMM